MRTGLRALGYVRCGTFSERAEACRSVCVPRARRTRHGALWGSALSPPIAPPIRQRRRFQIDAIDAETVQFLECGKLARDALDQVSKMRRLVVAIGDRQDVDLNRHGGVSRKLILAEASEDCLRADHDHLRSLDDLTSRPDGVFQLVATHQLAIWSTSIRSSCESSPPIGETSRISIESRSNPVKTRLSPGTSPRSISDLQRSRLCICGSPLTPLRSRSQLRWMVGSHCSRLVRVRCVESWRWSRHDRRSERVSSGTTGRRTTSSR